MRRILCLAFALSAIGPPGSQAGIVSSLFTCPCTGRDAPALYREGLEHGTHGRFDQATALFEEVLRLDPSHIPARRGLDLLRDVRTGRAQPPTARLLFEEVSVSERYGPTRALPLAREAVERQPAYYYSHHQLAVCLFELGRYEESLVEVSAALRDNDAYAYTYNNQGLALDRLGREAQALPAYRRAVEIDPSYYKAYKNIGVSLLFDRQVNEARAWFEHALDINPQYVFAFQELTLSERELAAGAASLGRESTEVLVRRLVYGSWQERRVAVELIRQRREPASETQLARLLDSPGPLVHYLVVEALEVFGGKCATRAIARATRDTDFLVRRRAGEALAHIDTAETCAALARAYEQERDDLTRSGYAYALSRCSWPGAAEVLLEGAKDQLPLGRQAARAALASAQGWQRVARQRHAPLLICLLDEKRPELQARVAAALAAIAHEDLGSDVGRWRSWCASHRRCRTGLASLAQAGVCP